MSDGHMPLTQQQLRDLLDYDPDTGIFRWRTRPSNVVRIGDPAGGRNVAGYVVIGINGKTHFAHRLAWLHVNGEWPAGMLDHIDGNPSNNSISNLRLATPSMNGANSKHRSNNTSGHKGVSLIPESNRWRATIKVGRRRIHIGVFANKEDAIAAYRDAARAHFGEFARP